MIDKCGFIKILNCLFLKYIETLDSWYKTTKYDYNFETEVDQEFSAMLSVAIKLEHNIPAAVVLYFS